MRICLVLTAAAILSGCSPQDQNPPARQVIATIPCYLNGLERADLYASTGESQDAVRRINTHLSNSLTLSERVTIMAKLVCDTAETELYRAIVLDALLETYAIIRTLDSGESMKGNWSNLITKTVGTVHILDSSAVAVVPRCHTISYPTSPFGRRDVVATAVERFCRTVAGWKFDSAGRQITYGYSDGMFVMTIR